MAATVMQPVTKNAIDDNCGFVLYYQEQRGETAIIGLFEWTLTVFPMQTTS